MKAARQLGNLFWRSGDKYSSISNALSSPANRKDLQKIHSLLITLGLQNSATFLGILITKYSQFKDTHSALLVFGGISPQNDVYVWNTIIRAMTHNRCYTKALEFYAEMRELGVKPDNYTFPSVINACGSLVDFEKGRVVHEHVVELGFQFDLYISNALIDMYARCNELGCAQLVFDGMPQRDIVSWNSLISGYTSNGYYKEALDVYNQLRMVGLLPDSFSLSNALLSCGGLGEVVEGEVVHCLVEKLGTRRDVNVSNALLAMYFKCDVLANCTRIFSEMVHRDSVTWNTIISSYFESGLYHESMRLFLEMVRHSKPDILTITSVFRACTCVGDLDMGRYVHDYMLNNGYECNIVATNIVINMYAKCGDVVQARQVFENAKNRDLVSWNSLLDGYVENQSYQEAIELFRRMRTNFQPDFVTYVTLFSMSSGLTNLNFTEELHCDIIKRGFGSTQIVGNALVDAYAKCGKVEDSFKQFESMKFRDTITWNSIIASCSHSDSHILGLRMLNKMRLEGIIPDIPTFLSSLPLCSYLMAKRQGKEMHCCIFKFGFDSNIPIGNALIEMYSNTGSLRNSILVFEKMKEKDLVSWTAIISSYGMYGEGRKALETFEHMKAAGILPDHIVFIAVLYACSHSGLVQEGRICFEQMKTEHNIVPRMEHYACIVDLLSRSGLLAEAEEFISLMPLKPDASIWGLLLSACRANGDMKIAERVAERVLQLDTCDPGYHVLASNVYAASGRWDQVGVIRKSFKANGLKKDPEDHHLYGTRPWKGRQSQCLVLSYMCLTLERVGLVIMNTYLKVNNLFQYADQVAHPPKCNISIANGLPPKKLLPFSCSSRNFRFSIIGPIASSWSFPSEVKTLHVNGITYFSKSVDSDVKEFVYTLSSPKLAQNRAMAFSLGSWGRRGGCFHTSSMYSRITRDSQTGLPLCRRTGTFLCTGLYSRSEALFLSYPPVPFRTPSL